MKLRISLLFSLVGVSVLAQHAAEPQLKVRILLDKNSYSPEEKVIVKAELTNATSKTLCFPVPDQNCETTATGWIVTTGERISSQEHDQFICHVDGGGAVGAKLTLK